jgi:hypothetical protein
VVGDPQVDGDRERTEEGTDGAAEDGAHPGVAGGNPAQLQQQVTTARCSTVCNIAAARLRRRDTCAPGPELGR